MQNKTKNRIRDVVEIVLILIMTTSGVGTFFSSPEMFRETGPIVEWLGAQWALWFYGLVFLTEGLWLAYAKVFKKKHAHKHALFAIYITTIFTILLEVLLAPLTLAFLDNILIAIAAGWCWIGWKFHIDYIDPEEFRKQIEQLRKE